MTYRKPYEIPELPWRRRALMWLGRVRWRIPLGITSLGTLSAGTVLLVVWGITALVRACPGQNHIPTAGRVVGMHYSPPSATAITSCYGSGQSQVCTSTPIEHPATWTLSVRVGDVTVDDNVSASTYAQVHVGSPVCVTYTTRTNGYDVTGAGCAWRGTGQ